MREQKECNTKKRIETLFILIVLNAFACTSQLHIAEPYTQCRCVLYVCVLFYRLSKRRDGKEWPINVGINNNLGISHFNWNDLQMKVSFQFHLKTCAHLLLSGFLFALVLIRLGLIVHQKVFPIRIWSDSVFYSSLIIFFWCFVDSKERILLFWLIPSMFKDKILHIRKLDLLIKMSRTTFSEMNLTYLACKKHVSGSRSAFDSSKLLKLYTIYFYYLLLSSIEFVSFFHKIELQK